MTQVLHTTMRGPMAAGYALEQEGAWLVAKERTSTSGDPLRDFLGLPGLWRGLRVKGGSGAGNSERVQRVFELAPAIRQVADPWGDPEHEADPDAGLLDWAAATARGRFSGEVRPPCTEDIEEWAPPRSRRIRAGSHVSQVEVIADASRVALVVPALVPVPSGLSQTREAWLAELCHDAQERWRLVRFGIDDSRQSVRAEVDLTGAPSELYRVLFELCLTALTASAAWALPGLSLVVDSSIRSRMLDRMPS
jgi:hypothetical protein